MRGGGINATTSWQRIDFCGGSKRERNMVVDDIIGALGMENKTIDWYQILILLSQFG
jgi:hypothetical protein